MGIFKYILILVILGAILAIAFFVVGAINELSDPTTWFDNIFEGFGDFGELFKRLFNGNEHCQRC